jgi:NADPH:quinone reductase-like Zn-dependent oxidoreductase
MKTILHDRYGPPDEVLRFGDIDVPSIGDRQVLVRVRAASVHADIWHIVTGWPYFARAMGNGLLKPKRRVPGTDFAGEVERVGEKVTRFRPGDQVFGGPGLMLGWLNLGTYAEYAAYDEEGLARKPASVTFEQAACVGATGAIVIANIGRTDRLAGRNVLINGGGGSAGTTAIQIARAAGARVTGVDRAEKLELMRRLGADRAIDFSQEDFTRGSEKYDFILDVVSNRTVQECRRVLTPRGLYVNLGHTDYGHVGGPVWGTLPAMLRTFARSFFDPNLPKIGDSKMPSRQEMMAALEKYLEAGTLTPVVARTFPLSEIHAAMRCLQDPTIPGRIVIIP